MFTRETAGAPRSSRSHARIMPTDAPEAPGASGAGDDKPQLRGRSSRPGLHELQEQQRAPSGGGRVSCRASTGDTCQAQVHPRVPLSARGLAAGAQAGGVIRVRAGRADGRSTGEPGGRRPCPLRGDPRSPAGGSRLEKAWQVQVCTVLMSLLQSHHPAVGEALWAPRTLGGEGTHQGRGPVTPSQPPEGLRAAPVAS